MEQDKKRPTERGRTTVTRERPQTPASRPKGPRTRTGTASEREAARQARIAPAGTSEGRRQTGAERTRSHPQPEPERTRSHSQPEPERTRSHRQAEAERSPVRRSPQNPKQEQKPVPQKAAPKKAAEPSDTASAHRSRKKKPHRVYNTNFAFKFLIMLAVVAVIVLSMIIFFKVKHIEVILPENPENGKSYYTAEEIRQASGIHLDDNLLSVGKATVAAKIQKALPYVNEIQIKIQLPGTVVISFTEFEITYGIQDETGGWWLMSREGRILEEATEQTVRGHLVVTGMPIQRPEAGDYFIPAATEGADMSEIAAKQKVVLDFLPALEQAAFAKQIVTVDVSASYDLTLWYGTRYQIRLGTTKDLSYKLQYLQAVLEDKEIQRRSGTIDLTFTEDDKVHFLEFR